MTDHRQTHQPRAFIKTLNKGAMFQEPKEKGQYKEKQ